MSDWEASSEVDLPKQANSSSKQPVKGRSRWEGEDEEETAPASDWDASSGDETVPTPVPKTAPPKKKGSLKAKLAEKEAEREARKNSQVDDEYNSDEVLDPQEKARRDREQELNADLRNAADLLGAAALGGTENRELDSLLTFQPRTKEDFQQLSSRIIEVIIKQHQNKPLYPSFVEHHARELAGPLKDVEVRKAASSLTTLANEKQKEQREKASGKKKSKAAAKPALGGAKASTKLDTGVYDEALDDLGTNDDFM